MEFDEFGYVMAVLSLLFSASIFAYWARANPLKKIPYKALSLSLVGISSCISATIIGFGFSLQYFLSTTPLTFERGPQFQIQAHPLAALGDLASYALLVGLPIGIIAANTAFRKEVFREALLIWVMSFVFLLSAYDLIFFVTQLALLDPITLKVLTVQGLFFDLASDLIGGTIGAVLAGYASWKLRESVVSHWRSAKGLSWKRRMLISPIWRTSVYGAFAALAFLTVIFFSFIYRFPVFVTFEVEDWNSMRYKIMEPFFSDPKSWDEGLIPYYGAAFTLKLPFEKKNSRISMQILPAELDQEKRILIAYASARNVIDESISFDSIYEAFASTETIEVLLPIQLEFAGDLEEFFTVSSGDEDAEPYVRFSYAIGDNVRLEKAKYTYSHVFSQSFQTKKVEDRIRFTSLKGGGGANLELLVNEEALLIFNKLSGEGPRVKADKEEVPVTSTSDQGERLIAFGTDFSHTFGGAEIQENSLGEGSPILSYSLHVRAGAGEQFWLQFSEVDKFELLDPRVSYQVAGYIPNRLEDFHSGEITGRLKIANQIIPVTMKDQIFLALGHLNMTDKKDGEFRLYGYSSHINLNGEILNPTIWSRLPAEITAAIIGAVVAYLLSIVLLLRRKKRTT